MAITSQLAFSSPAGAKHVSPTLGILGGMGPLATVDFLQKLIARTPASRDQEHIPLIVFSIPQIPDRSTSILGCGPSPFPKLIEFAQRLADAGAGCIAIPCNTAHYWADRLAAEGPLPILHMADAVCAHLAEPPGAKVGLLATSGTLRAAIYQQRFAEHQWSWELPTQEEQQDWVSWGITQVKGGKLKEGGHFLSLALRALLDRGASRVVLACTEIPLALQTQPGLLAQYTVDATDCLAEACLQWWYRQAGATSCPPQ